MRQKLAGPCDYTREVVKIRAHEVVLKTEGGLDSYLGLGRGITIQEFEGGFIVIDPNYDGQLVYRWLTESDNALLGD